MKKKQLKRFFNMENIIKIDTNELTAFAEEAGKFVFKQSAEENLLKLLKLKKLIDDALEKAKADIEEAGKKISPDFKGVVGQQIKAIYRSFGEKYTYNKEKVIEASPYLKEIIWRKVKSDEVNAYVKANDKLPEGIIEKDRQPKISISVKNLQLPTNEQSK